MLPLHSYRIKVIHYHNPHLIWADKDNVLEQIGVYGIVPHGKTLTFNPETSSYCFSEIDVNKWLPAAMNLMKEFFEDAKETWFSQTYSDDGGIFDDGKHKFGEIYIKSKDGVLINLSEFLTQSLFAIVDVDAFHERLTQKLYTKFNYPDIKDVIKKLNLYYKKVTNKFEMYEKDLTKYMIDYAGDVLDEINWKFVVPEPMNDNYIMKNFWQKMDEKPKNMKMLKKLEMLKMLNKKIADNQIENNNTYTEISSHRKEENDLTVKIKEEIKKEKKTDIKPAKVKNDGTSDEDIDDIMQYIDNKYPKRNLKVIKNAMKADKIDLTSITSSMCGFVEKIVTPVVMVHSKLKKKINPTFALRDIPFNEHIRIVLKKMSVTQPMAIQSVTWHTILRGHSVFIIAPKFSGKTMGYLPSVCRLISDGTPESNSAGPISIIVCATAESVAQVGKNAKMLLGLKERILTVYPGVDDMFVSTSLLNGCDLLISTPSILVRLLRDFDIDLRRLRIFVLDDSERLNEVYRKEVRFFQHRVKEVEKSRSNRELKVQYVVVSRIWCDFMVALAKKAPDTVVCIGAFPECVVYSKASMTVSFVNDKIASVLEFLDDNDASKKVVIVCRSDEVKTLANGLKSRKNYIFACYNEMTLSDLHNVNSGWREYDASLIGPILVCTDENLSHLNITDANLLVHYSLPKTYSFFRKRFFVLNDNYPSIFHPSNDSVKVKIILEDVNTEKLPKILNFIKRCADVPAVLNEICDRILAEKDLKKAQTFVPICSNLFTLGYCPELYDCQNRHTVLKGYDDPPDWLPRTGVVTFKILHLHTAANYSARLLSHIEGNKEKKYPAMYTLSIKLGMYFGNVNNRQLHGIPKVGDICAVSLKQDSFARCQVVKIIGQHRGSYRVLIKLLDEEKLEETRDIFLFHLPESLSNIETYTVQIRLANVHPKDNDVTFSTLALDHIKNLVDDEDSHVRGRIAAVVGNCLFVDTLEVCENLSTLDQIVIKHDLKQELLRKHAEEQPDHINKIKELCGQNFSTASAPVLKTTKRKNNGSWAHLNIGEMEGVFIMSVINPEHCLLRISKFEPCMQVLLKDIKKYVDDNHEPLADVEVGNIVLAKFPEDDTYERARVDKIDGGMLNCFFVDQGESAFVPLKDSRPITDKLIDKLPFQCIECRLIGLKPPGDEWTEFCNTWLSNYTDEGTKHFFAKAITKQPAIYTGGNKYSIALIDTSSSTDIIVNQLLIDLNLASKLADEIHHLDDVVPNIESKSSEEWEKVDNSPGIPKATSNVLMAEPIRSVPLIASDCESNESDPWEMYNMADFTSHLKNFNKPEIKQSTSKQNLPAIMPIPETQTEQTNTIHLSIPSKSNDLDSDDTTSSIKPQCTIIDETRRPKLLWRQDISSVHIKIQLIGVDKYDLTIKERYIKFSTHLNDTEYSFDFELYGVVDTEKSSHCNKGQYILVKLVKVLQKNWGTLGNFDRIKRWIVYDVDNLDASSDEEVIEDSLVKIVKEIHQKEETDSDDDVLDDVICDGELP